MTNWWLRQKAALMPKYVTLEHFDAAIAGLDNKFVTTDRFDSAMVRIEERFTQIDRRFVQIDQRFGDIVNTLEGMTTILRRLDQERVFTLEWIRRIESDVTLVKKHLKLA